MSEVDPIAEGRAAWAKVHSSTSFEAWKAIAVALAIGRQHSLRLAKVNAPHGARYSRALNAWLSENGFSTMAYGLRAKCCKLADNLVAIEAWRAGLPEGERDSQNNPEVILRNWRRATRAETPAADVAVSQRQHVVKSDKPQRNGKPIYWPGDCIKRAALAMRESRSSDLFILAKLALEAALPSRADLLDLLNEPAPTRAPVKSPMPAEAAALA
jgi:hypothetical protein